MTTITPRHALHVLVAASLALLVAAVPGAPPARAQVTGRAVAIAADPLGPGYWILMANGRVIPRGSARNDGSAPAFSGRATAVAAYPTGKGFWRARGNGVVHAFGVASVTAARRADRQGRVIGVAVHHRGKGLWRVTSKGQVLAAGKATSYGRIRSSEPIRAVAGHPEASGYWAVNRRGKVFAYGAANVLGTPAGRGATGIAAHPGSSGYWVVKRSGKVFAYGTAGHYGNASFDVPVVDIAAAPDGAGYWVLARDGRVRAFGSARSGMISTSGPPKPDLVTVGGITVASSIGRKVGRLLRDAKEAGIDYYGWGYRDREVQIRLRQEHCGLRYYDVFVKSSGECSPMTATPGRSMHERGLAIDFVRRRSDGSTTAIAGTRAFRWLKRNASKYGLYNLPAEPWHWSTTGT